MTYFNYFSQCSKKSAGGLSVKHMITLAVVAAVVCGGLYGWYSFLCIRYSQQIDYLTEIQGNEEFQQQYEVAQTVSGQIGSAQKELVYLGLLDEFSQTLSTVNGKLFQTIEACLAEGASLTAIEVEQTAVSLTGTAPELQSLIRMERSFRQTGASSAVLIAEAGDQDPGTSGIDFYCELTLDGGAIIDGE